MGGYDISKLAQALEYFKVDNPSQKLDLLIKYFALISENRLWGSLTSRSVAINPIIPVVQSLSMLQAITRVGPGGIGEIGSGGGILGISLAIARDDWIFTLIESNARKSAFLAEVSGKLRLKNVIVKRSRAENLAGKADFDYVVSRAAGRLDSLLPVGLALAGDEGQFLTLKGKAQAKEIEKLQREGEVAAGSERSIRIDFIEPKLPEWFPENSRVLIVVARKIREDIGRGS